MSDDWIDSLCDLISRMDEAELKLVGMAEEHKPRSIEAIRLDSKANGVRLASGYVSEELRRVRGRPVSDQDIVDTIAEASRSHYLFDEAKDGPHIASCRCDVDNPSITNGCEDGGWMPWDEYHNHFAAAILAALRAAGYEIFTYEELRIALTAFAMWLRPDELDVVAVEIVDNFLEETL